MAKRKIGDKIVVDNFLPEDRDGKTLKNLAKRLGLIAEAEGVLWIVVFDDCHYSHADSFFDLYRKAVFGE